MDMRIVLIECCLLWLHTVCAYQDYSISSLCPSGVINTFNKLLDNRPELHLGHNGESAALVHETWNSSSFKRLDECKFSVDANYKLPKGRTRGLYVSIRKLNLRESPTKTGCIDYIQFKFGTQKTPKLCGQLNASNNTSTKKMFHTERGGVVKVTIFIDKLRPLKYVEDTLDVELVFTAFDDCYSLSNGFRCNSDDCISDVFASDGYVNCPPPEFSDEPGIIYLTNEPTPNNTDIVISALTSLIFTLVGVGSCLWLCWHIKDCFNGESTSRSTSTANMNSNNNNRRTNNTTRTTQFGAGSGDESTILEMPATTSNTIGNPSAPALDAIKDDKPPSYDSLFPKTTTNS